MLLQTKAWLDLRIWKHTEILTRTYLKCHPHLTRTIKTFKYLFKSASLCNWTKFKHSSSFYIRIHVFPGNLTKMLLLILMIVTLPVRSQQGNTEKLKIIKYGQTHQHFFDIIYKTKMNLLKLKVWSILYRQTE